MKKKPKVIRDYSWLTDDVLVRMNHVRYRANLEDLTREQWVEALNAMDQKQVEALKWYCEGN